MFLSTGHKGEGFGGPFDRRFVSARPLNVGDRFIDGQGVWQVSASGHDSRGSFFIVFQMKKNSNGIERNEKFYYTSDAVVEIQAPTKR